VSVALDTKHAMGMGHIVMCPVWLYNIFPHYLIKGKIFEKKVVDNKNVRFDFLHNLVRYISHFKKN
jgi:hypothetical protein